MVRLIALVTRRADLDQAAFARYWTHVHAPLAARQGMARYTINVAIDPQPDAAVAPYDGTAEIWWDSVEAMQAGLAGPAGVAAAADLAEFTERVEFLVAEGHDVDVGADRSRT